MKFNKRSIVCLILLAVGFSSAYAGDGDWQYDSTTKEYKRTTRNGDGSIGFEHFKPNGNPDQATRDLHGADFEDMTHGKMLYSRQDVDSNGFSVSGAWPKSYPGREIGRALGYEGTAQVENTANGRDLDMDTGAFHLSAQIRNRDDNGQPYADKDGNTYTYEQGVVRPKNIFGKEIAQYVSDEHMVNTDPTPHQAYQNACRRALQAK